MSKITIGRLHKALNTRLRMAQRRAEDARFWWLTRSVQVGNSYRRIYFYHVRKAGGTSINHMFLGGKPVYSRLSKTHHYRMLNNDRVFVGWNQRIIEQGYYFYAFSHIPAHQLTLPPDTFTFTCLRDPARRVVSHYKMLLETAHGLAPEHESFTEESTWMGENFGDFLDRIPREHLLNQLYMFSPSFDPDEAYDRITNCAHWFLTEQFEAGIATLSEKLGLDLKPLHTRRTSIDPQLTTADHARLREVLAPEYVLYERLQAQKHA